MLFLVNWGQGIDIFWVFWVLLSQFMFPRRLIFSPFTQSKCTFQNQNVGNKMKFCGFLLHAQIEALQVRIRNNFKISSWLEFHLDFPVKAPDGF